MYRQRVQFLGSLCWQRCSPAAVSALSKLESLLFHHTKLVALKRTRRLANLWIELQPSRLLAHITVGELATLVSQLVLHVDAAGQRTHCISKVTYLLPCCHDLHTTRTVRTSWNFPWKLIGDNSTTGPGSFGPEAKENVTVAWTASPTAFVLKRLIFLTSNLAESTFCFNGYFVCIRLHRRINATTSYSWNI